MRSLNAVLKAPWQSRARLGATIGLRMLGLYTLPIVALLLVAGPEPTVRRDLTVRLDLLAITYPFGAGVGGAFMALLLPICRRRPVAVIAGIFSFAWFAAGIAVTLDHGYIAWRMNHAVTTLLMSGVFGGMLGDRIWRTLRMGEPRHGGDGTVRRASYLT